MSANKLKHLRVKIKTFFFKHRAGLSLIGLCLVFTTFVFKEGIKEHYKELFGAVDSAASLFNISNLTAAAFNETRQTEALMEFMANDYRQMDADSGDSEILQMLLPEQCRLSRMNILNLRRLTEHLPNRKQTDEELNSLAMRLVPIEKALAGPTGDELREIMSNPRVKDSPTLKQFPSHLTEKQMQATVKARHDFFEDLSNKIYSIDTQLDKMKDKEMEIAEAERVKDEGYYSTATWFSYLLYGFGWLVTLIGHFLGESKEEIEI
jgi:hypothetical protein